MLEPGYVATFRTTFNQTGEHLMPCHEFCGVGHQGMWAHVKVTRPRRVHANGRGHAGEFAEAQLCYNS